MKFTVLFSEITDQLKEMSRIAASNKPEASMQNILMTVKDKKLIMRSTDGNIELEAEVPLVDVESDGSTTINAGKLFEVCNKSGKNSAATITLDKDAQMLRVDADNTVYEIRSPSADTFPSFEDVNDGLTVTLKQKQLKELLEMAEFCVTNDDFRDYLRGIRFEGDDSHLSVFSSDGHRMAILETTLLKPLNEPLRALLTKNSATQIGNIINASSDQPVNLIITKNTVSVNCNGYKLKSKLIVCAYPNVRSVIPSNIDSTVEVDTKRFSSLVSRVAVISSKRVNGVTMTFGNNTYSLRASNSERETAVHTEKIDSYEGSLVEVSLNASYVIETLGHIKTEKTKLHFPSPLNSVLFSPVTEGTTTNDSISAKYIISKIAV